MMSLMSESRETTLNASLSAASPWTKRDSFHWPKYSLIVGTITTSDVNASDAVGSHACASVSSSRRVALERLGRGRQDARVGQRLAELDRAVAVEVGLHLRGQIRAGAPEHALGEVEEVARLLEHAAVGQLQVERHRALRILFLARARVEDDVVLGERRRPGDDSLDLLVVRVGLDPALLRVREDARDVLAMLLEQARVVVVDALGEGVVLLCERGELLGGARQLRGVVGEIALDAGEVVGVDRSARRLGGGRRRRCGVVRIVAAAAGEQDEQCDKGSNASHVRRTLQTFVGVLRRSLYKNVQSYYYRPMQRTPIAALVAAEIVSILGSRMTYLALPWFVLVTTGSVAKMTLRPCRGDAADGAARDPERDGGRAARARAGRCSPATRPGSHCWRRSRSCTLRGCSAFRSCSHSSSRSAASWPRTSQRSG